MINPGLEAALYTILDLSAKVGFGFIVVSASNETLAQASNSNRIMENIHNYMDSETSYHR